MGEHVPANLPDGLKQSIVQYGGLKTARKLYGENHPYVLNRAANVVKRFVRNFTGMSQAYRILYDEYEVPLEGASLRRRTWFWPRNFYFNYPNEFVGTWHLPRSDWKRRVMQKYCTPAQLGSVVTRYELFCIQKKMHEEDILDMGW